ncbi:hypothetical protein CDEST_04526 [Colletotrichum destructivum]|uniref:Uncharacterized protein n=1 Tax=Colletotrichum destructivum TaxID=34406 RepID=A0AAX4I7Z8_9PEZI|nr:hypothetical protein CDEST_04526 [Colletotrichum destructivum]
MGNTTSRLLDNKLTHVLPATVDVEATSADGIALLMRQLLSLTSMRDVDSLTAESASVRAIFQRNKLEVLRNLIAPEAWDDAIACVDRRLRMGKAARRAFHEDYDNGIVSSFPSDDPLGEGGSRGDNSGKGGVDDGRSANTSPATPTKEGRRHPRPTDRGQWDLDDLCNLVRIIERLLSREHHNTYPTFAKWEASWKSPWPRRNVHAYRPVSSREGADWTVRDYDGREHHYEELCRDHGTEDPENFEYAFQRHTNLDQDGVPYEGVTVNSTTRPRLQRALFRLELLRRAHYQRPLFPRGARFASRTRTVREGVFGPAGETYETRRARAGAFFRGWAADDFLEAVCVFKATLNEYAVPVSEMMEDFMVAVDETFEAPEQLRVDRVCGDIKTDFREVPERAAGLRWVKDPSTGEESLRIVDGLTESDEEPDDAQSLGVTDDHDEPDEKLYAARAKLLDDKEELDIFTASLMVPFDRFEFDDLRSTIFRSERCRAMPRHRRQREHPSLRPPLRETSPDEAMSRFLHVLCSLPLAFLGEFMVMPTSRQRDFLKASYWALSRVKASQTPLFLSGEMSAWSSRPPDGVDGPDRDLGAVHDARLFPALSVRAAAIACVCDVYVFQEHPSMGFRVLADSQDDGDGGGCGWRWRWTTARMAPVLWERLRSEMRFENFDIDGVFRMSPESWAAVWRSDREFERQLWTGPKAETERWEGYRRAAAGRRDPDECYCRLGDRCALCLPLPDVKHPERELFTKEEWEEEKRDEREDMRPFRLCKRHPDLAKSIREYRKTHKAVLY